MLPGKSADMADRARSVISKYITDSIGVAAQARGRQQDALDNWIAQSDRQQRLLAPDPWQQYQFNLEVTQEVSKFREALLAQSKPGIARMATEIKHVVAKVAPIINLMPTYELRTAWYNLMVQLKEGLMLYQAQVTAADAALVAKADEYLRMHPAVPRPSGSPPAQNPGPKAPEAPPLLPATAATQPALKEAPRPPQQQDSGGTVGGLIVVGGMLAVAGALFARLRKRKGAIAAPADTK